MTDLVMDAATKFVGRAIGRLLKRAFDERVAPGDGRPPGADGRPGQDDMLREQIAIAERYPDLRACMNDNVAFLAGGSRAVPVPRSNLTGDSPWSRRTCWSPS